MLVNWKEFIKIKKEKIIIILIILILSYILDWVFIKIFFQKCSLSESIFETIFRCNYHNEVFLLIKGILLYPIYIVMTIISYYIPIPFVLNILIIFVLQAAYFYILACILFYTSLVRNISKYPLDFQIIMMPIIITFMMFILVMLQDIFGIWFGPRHDLAGITLVIFSVPTLILAYILYQIIMLKYKFKTVMQFFMMLIIIGNIFLISDGGVSTKGMNFLYNWQGNLIEYFLIIYSIHTLIYLAINKKINDFHKSLKENSIKN